MHLFMRGGDHPNGGELRNWWLGCHGALTGTIVVRQGKAGKAVVRDTWSQHPRGDWYSISALRH